jgi:hypothetical protein
MKQYNKNSEEVITVEALEKILKGIKTGEETGKVSICGELNVMNNNPHGENDPDKEVEKIWIHRNHRCKFNIAMAGNSIILEESLEVSVGEIGRLIYIQIKQECGHMYSILCKSPKLLYCQAL